MDKLKLSSELDSIINRLRTARSEEEALWEQVRRYVLPRRFSEVEQSPGGHKTERRILDTTAPKALEVFASFLFSGTCNPQTNWIPLSLSGPAPDPGSQEAKWLDGVSILLRQALESPTADVYTAMHEAYLDLGAFGTAILYIEPAQSGREADIRIIYCPLASTFIDVGADGVVDRVFRTCQWTGRQVRQRWPGRTDLGRTVMGLENDQTSPVNFIHAVFPATDEGLVSTLPQEHQAKIAAAKWPFVSVWLNQTDDVLVSVGGYEEFPYVTPRWYTVGMSVYGRSPSMTAMGDILLVNHLAHQILRGIERLNNPPMVAPFGALRSALRTYPGGITYTDGAGQLDFLLPPGASRVEYGEAFLAQRQASIREAYYVPLILTQQMPVRTATEVLAVQDERNRATGPMIHRMKAELFDGLVRRVFGLLQRAGAIPPPPPGLDLGRVRIDYQDPVSTSVRVHEGLSIMRLLETLGPWAQAIGFGLFDHIDSDRLFGALATAYGVPKSIIATGAEVRSLRKQKAAEAQQQQRLDAASQLAPTLQAVASLKKVGNGQ